MCNSRTSQIVDVDPTLKEDDASSSLATASANQPQEQERTQMPDACAVAPPKYPNKKSTHTMNNDPQGNSVDMSTVQKKVLMECTEDDILGFLAVLRTTNGKTVEESTEAVDEGTRVPVPLHYNNQYIECENLSEFNLDFDSFSYRMNESGTKMNRDSREAIRQAECQATKTIVTAIMDAGDDDQQ